ncbi:SDR family NAD(P)-dependent oxidoreductase [Caldisericum exile]|uniref:SDR family NAD(P)-dependent oxidoreductase n=1 Tax=Caldisericum exile TaxID=693075 RepID=UPI0005A20266|nr:SDR family oxidoreductase [Caldisericum exile]
MGKSILVVGGSSGIGRATSLLLDNLGAKVIATGRTKKHIDETLRLSARIVLGQFNLPYDINELLNWVKEKTDSLNGIVFSQGVIFTEPFETFRDHELESMWKINVESSFKILRDLLPLFKNGGSVVFVSSIDAFFGEREPSSGYALTKSAIIGLTNALAYELGKYKIRVNSILPGLIRTNMTEDFFKSEFDSVREEFLRRVPLGREGSPTEVAKLITFLLSDDASYITGDSIFIDGGYHTA